MSFAWVAARWDPRSLGAEAQESTGVSMGCGMSSCAEVADAWTLLVRPCAHAGAAHARPLVIDVVFAWQQPFSFMRPM